jgi:hypothetical protein
MARIVMYNKPTLQINYFNFSGCIYSIFENKDLELDLRKCNYMSLTWDANSFPQLADAPEP